MARASTPERQQQWRDKIQSSELINRLNAYAMGDIAMDRDRIKAIEILLRKTLPDLKAIEHTGPGGSELTITINKVTYDSDH